MCVCVCVWDGKNEATPPHRSKKLNFIKKLFLICFKSFLDVFKGLKKIKNFKKIKIFKFYKNYKNINNGLNMANNAH